MNNAVKQNIVIHKRVEEMKKRDTYLNKLILYKNTTDLIKVITGVRRCGKSSLLLLYKEYLKTQGVSESHIFSANFESFEFDDITTAKNLNDLILKHKPKKGTYYVMLDEVQLVNDWEKAVNSLRLDSDIDIYLTGSNTYMLNSKLAELLSGRYVELHMLPLSFSEFLSFGTYEISDSQDIRKVFNYYLEYGGFPGLWELNDNDAIKRDYLNGIYSTVIVKDIVKMNNVRDVDLLEKVFAFLARNIGNLVSTKTITDFITSSGRKTSNDTIDSYLKMFENSYLMYRAKRHDIKGKAIMKTNDKFYITDIGIRNMLSGMSGGDYGSVLENIIYLELIRRNFNVSIGKLNNLEVDFIAEKPNEKVYYQVTASMVDSNVQKRELLPLESISDSYPKVVLSMDSPGPYDDFNGIKHLNIIEFLLEYNV